MIKFTTKLALATGLVVVYSGLFVTLASDGTYSQDDRNKKIRRTVLVQQKFEVSKEANGPAKTSSIRDGFFPMLPLDMKKYLAKYLRERNNVLILARVNKDWHYFIWDTEFIQKEKSKWTTPPLSARHELVQQNVRRWCELRSMEILNNVLFRPEWTMKPSAGVKLWTMPDTNGEIISPSSPALHSQCFTRRTETFVRPAGENKAKTLILLLTPSELKNTAQNISKNALFLETVDKIDLSQNSVCVCIRHGKDNQEEWGFVCTILNFRDAAYMPLWEIYIKGVVMMGWSSFRVRHNRFFDFSGELSFSGSE